VERLNLLLTPHVCGAVSGAVQRGLVSLLNLSVRRHRRPG
jgi:hypothetical protein